jgi:cell filamentation protein
VNISKGSSQFHPASLIDVAATETFNWLRTTGLLSGKPLADHAFVEQSSDLLEKINYIHPFREGNGRTQRAFLDQVAALSGRNLAWRNVSQHDHLRASIEAFDHVSGEPFHAVLSRVIQPALDGLSLLDDGLFRVSPPVVSAPGDVREPRDLPERMRKFPELFEADPDGARPSAELEP